MASFKRAPSRSTSALSDALAARASNFNSSFCAPARGANNIPASAPITTNLMVYLPTPSIRGRQGGRRIFLRSEERQHGVRRRSVGHELEWDGAGFVRLVHGDGLP